MFICNKNIFSRIEFIGWLTGCGLLLAAVFSCNTLTKEKNQDRFFAAIIKADSSNNTRFYFTKSDMDYLDTAITTAKGAGLVVTAEKYLRKIRYYQVTMNDLDKALQHADSILLLLGNHHNDETLRALSISALFEKGNIYFKIKNYDEAIRNYSLGKMLLSVNLKDSSGLFLYYHSMAFALYAQHKYLQAARCFRMKYLKATRGADPYGEYLDIQESMDNTGMGYFRAGMHDSARYYYYATLDYIERNQKRFPKAPRNDFEAQRAVAWFNLGELLYLQKDTASAEKLFLKSMAGYDKRDKGFAGPLHLGLANLYMGSNQPAKASSILASFQQIVDSSELNRTTAEFYQTLSGYYRITGQLQAANKALLNSYNIRDSIDKRDRYLYSIDIQKEFENREQQITKLSLQKDNEVKNGYLLAAIAGILMALLIILLSWYYLWRKSVYAKKLTALNDKILLQNEDLQTTLVSLEQSNHENNRLVRIVAHDLKNPISAIRSLVYSMIKKEDNSDNKKALELIQSTCVYAISMIKDMLDNKRNLSTISKELVDMGRLIEQCTELSQAEASEKNQQIKLQVDYPVVMLNRQKILRVISNIVNNAIRYSPANTEIMIRLERKDNSVLLSVQDNGIGIPAGLQDKLLSVDPDKLMEAVSGDKSYGMGLSISRKIIEEHAGKIWFESETGKGSVFYVELPCNVN